MAEKGRRERGREKEKEREGERMEEGRTGRVRSEVATDRFGSLKSLQFNWKAAARARGGKAFNPAAGESGWCERKKEGETTTLQLGYQ